MCGIAGIHAYHYAANPIRSCELAAMSDHMAARGPDGQGLWSDDELRVGFAHRRLAVIELSDAGRQPMRTPDGRYVVVLNGEIYNYRALRDDLTARGTRFVSHSDTEVLLHLYAARGADMVSALRGMFALAIWDSVERTLLLARDPYGIKPLYYSDDGWTFRFASQVKALLACGAVSRDPDPAGRVGFFLMGSVPEPFTTYRAIRAVPAGSTMIVDCAGAHPAMRYHSIAKVYARGAVAPTTGAAAEAKFRESVLDSVRHHLVADVPVGAFLSAGIDSGASVGLMRDAGASAIHTLTIGFEEFAGSSDDETTLAAEIAQHYQTIHSTRIVSRAEFETDLPRIVDAMDQPSIDGVNMWFASKAARELGWKVAISGIGGDELLGGYPSFASIPRCVRACYLASRVPFLGALSRRLMRALGPSLGVNPKAAGLFEYGGNTAGAYLLLRGLFMPWELERVLDRDTIEEGLRRLKPLALIAGELRGTRLAPFARVATLESGLYMRNQLLRDADWASMAHSIEVRTPLVDSVLLARAAVLDWRSAGLSGKAMLAAAPSRRLPEAVLKRAKTGFTTPVAGWMRERKDDGVRDVSPTRAPRPWARAWSQTVDARFAPSA